MMKDFAASVNELFIVEELDPFIEDYARQFGIPVKGKELLPITGELSSSIIKKQLLNRSSESINISDPSTPLADNYISDLPVSLLYYVRDVRTEELFYVLNKLKLTVSGDIGCYTLGAMPPLQAMDSCICNGRKHQYGAWDRESKRKRILPENCFSYWRFNFIHFRYHRIDRTLFTIKGAQQSSYWITGSPGIRDINTIRLRIHISGRACRKVDFWKSLQAAIGVKRIKVADPLKIKEIWKDSPREEIEADEASVIIARSHVYY